MNPSDIDNLIDQARDAFPGDSVELRVCNHVVKCMIEMGSNLDGFRLGEIVSELELSGQAEAQAAVRALDMLSFGTDALLQRRFEYWPEGDDSVLQDPIPVEPTDVRDALQTGLFIDPRTGAQVPNFKELISIFYEPSDLSKALLEARL